MEKYAGVTKAKKKNGDVYYRSSMTIKSKHISLGSYDTPEEASKAYNEACDIIKKGKYEFDDYNDNFTLDFLKFVSLMNYRNTGIIFKTPIYLQTGYFYYYFSPDKRLIFDREDLFFYAEHKIQVRGGYYFICDYGSQYSIFSRYGIKNYAKKGVDYIFANHNEEDFRYENIMIVNEYVGVTQTESVGKEEYETVIHIKGNYVVGRYGDVVSAAVAYNKAVDTLAKNGVKKKFSKNYIQSLNSEQYKEIYDKVDISKRIKEYV
ncbi:MAG: hypothetical protein E7271_11195 [Lachnospiraceae bacterium]|jgi:hypothetical protein|nr:hypothetical protein [Lachnospiraceae bacterium]